MPEKKRVRLTTFDLLRGYFMVAIILNHLQWYPNGLDWVAARGSLYVTAAEGFFLISGIILGIVRVRKLITEPLKKSVALLLKRGFQLYVASIVLMLIFTLLGWWFFIDNPGLKAGIRPIDEPFLDVLWGALTFNYLYGWADFLRLYAIFLFASPLAVWLLRRGLWYVLMAISTAIWLSFSVFSGGDLSNELLMPISWQFIFFGGLTIGFYWEEITKWWSNVRKTIRRTITRAVIITAISTILLNVVIAVDGMMPGVLGETLRSIQTALAPYFNKESLPLPRIILFLIWFGFGFWLFQRFEPFIMKRLGWILLPFGTNSLYVYIIHAFVIFFAHLLTQHEPLPIILNVLGSFAVLGIILLCVRTKFLMKIIPR